MTKRLAILLSDPLTPILQKGEVTERYYNPCNFFEKIDFILCNDDQPKHDKLQIMAGNADITIHNLAMPKRFFWRSLGWHPFLMNSWLKQAQNLVETVCPVMVRSYGAHFNALMGQAIAHRASVPHMISLHNRPDVYTQDAPLKEKIHSFCNTGLALKVLAKADCSVAVYTAQLDFIKKSKNDNIQLAYNVINSKETRPKQDYAQNGPLKIMSVGRLIPGKNPTNILYALTQTPEATLTLIGDGPIRSRLEALCSTLNITERVHFIPSMDNNQLCSLLNDYDLFVAHNDYPGIPKAVMEPMLVGLPIIINEQSPYLEELSAPHVYPVQDTPTAYANAFQKLRNKSDRQYLGQQGRLYAESKWLPEHAEQRYANLYKQLLTRNFP